MKSIWIQYIKPLFAIPRKQFAINALILSIIFTILILIDQLTKLWAFKHWGFVSAGQVISENWFVGVRLVINKGMFGSMGSNIGFAWVQVITSIIAIILSIVALFSRNWITTFCISIIFSGAMGNILDRYITNEHYVRDWIFTPWTDTTKSGGTYNIADVQVMVGSSLLLIYLLYGMFIKKEEK